MESGDKLMACLLLAPDEPPACVCTNVEGASPVVLVCDHASNRIPRRLGTLGLGATELASHIAWDPGAAEVAHCLAERLDAPLVCSGYSRLVIDCNRPLTSEESIAEASGGLPVPGNRDLDAGERTARIASLFAPYHRTIATVLDRRAAAGRASVLWSIHSFTPQLNGQWRPWQVGFAYGRDETLAVRFITAMRRVGGIVVGHNQPYQVEDTSDYTIPVHGEQRNLPHVLIEIRQDELLTAPAIEEWAERLAGAYAGTEPVVHS